MQTTTIKSVLQRMDFSDFVQAAERAERERRANDRLAEIEARDAQRRQKARRDDFKQIFDMDRSEYQYLRNATAKHKQYQRWILNRRKDREILGKKF